MSKAKVRMVPYHLQSGGYFVSVSLDLPQPDGASKTINVTLPESGEGFASEDEARGEAKRYAADQIAADEAEVTQLALAAASAELEAVTVLREEPPSKEGHDRSASVPPAVKQGADLPFELLPSEALSESIPAARDSSEESEAGVQPTPSPIDPASRGSGAIKADFGFFG